MNSSAFTGKELLDNSPITVSIPNGTDLNTAFQPPAPKSLDISLLPVQSLSPDMLPQALRSWVFNIAKRLNCPPDYSAITALVMLGALIGTRCGIKPKQKDDWLVIANLWAAIVGNPSLLKTPSMMEALKPLGRLEAAAKEEYKAQKKIYDQKAMAVKAQKDAIKSAMTKKAKAGESLDSEQEEFAKISEEEEPKERRYKTNDATVEKLTELLKSNPTGLLVFRDELVGLLASWDKAGRESDRAFYLEAWNGNGHHTCDRIGRGTTYVEHCCISLLGAIQPSKLLGYLIAASGYENDGFVQRLQLLVYPDSPKRCIVDEYPDSDARSKVNALVEAIESMNFYERGASANQFEKIPAFHFDPYAQNIFYNWLTDLQSRIELEMDNPLIAEHLSKYNSLMPSMALIFHVVELAEKLLALPKDCDPVEILRVTGPSINQENALMAVKWCAYLETHARRVYGMVKTELQLAASEIAKKLKCGKVAEEFTAKSIYQNGWQYLSKPETVKEALGFLEDAGWIIQSRPELATGGRPAAPVYTVNSQIFAANVTI